MVIAAEKILKMREILDNIDKAVYRLTDVFFVDLYELEVSEELLKTLQVFITHMSLLIPDISAYLNLMDRGIFDNFEAITDRFEMMEEYVKTTEMCCGELLTELKLSE
jgi:hypothetical protein